MEKGYACHQTSEIDGKVQRVVFSAIVKKHDVCDDSGLDSLGEGSTTCFVGQGALQGTSAGPAAMPLSTQAPMKLPYVCAFALQILLTRQIKVERM
jgi:hypothetical protein